MFQLWGRGVTWRALSEVFSDLKKKRHPSLIGKTSRALAVIATTFSSRRIVRYLFMAELVKCCMMQR